MANRRDDDDTRAYEEAMRGARPLAGRPGRVAGASPTSPALAGRPAALPRNPRATLLDADGAITSASFSITAAGDRIEGRAPGVDARAVRRLRSGEPRIEARLDLHGRAREAALLALERFVQSSRSAGRRALLVIHGRGGHTEDGAPVLKPMVWRWLASSRAASAAVLAFTSASPGEGGDGATIVLLRKPPR